MVGMVGMVRMAEMLSPPHANRVPCSTRPDTWDCDAGLRGTFGSAGIFCRLCRQKPAARQPPGRLPDLGVI